MVCEDPKLARRLVYDSECPSGRLLPLGREDRLSFTWPSSDGSLYTTKEEEDSLAKLVTPITVAANRTTTVDAVLTKGASISGVLRFDDGSPDAEGLVALLYKGESGKWAPYLPATAAENFRSAGGNP